MRWHRAMNVKGLLPGVASMSFMPRLAPKTQLFLFTTGQRPQPGCAMTCDILTMLRVLGCGWHLRTVSVLALRSLVTKSFLQHAFPELLLSTRLHGGGQGSRQQWGWGALTRDPVEPSS